MWNPTSNSKIRVLSFFFDEETDWQLQIPFDKLSRFQNRNIHMERGGISGPTFKLKKWITEKRVANLKYLFAICQDSKTRVFTRSAQA